MVGYIYLTTDTTNGKQYVGQHHYDKEGELDPNYHGSGIIISRIYKERPETLKEEYIKTCYSDSEMNDDEKYYIKLYKTLWPNGYNLSEGGDGVIPCEETRRKISSSLKGLCAGEKHPNYGKHLSEETRRKISTANKGKNHSEETRKKISSSHKGLQAGENNPFYGKHLSDEHKKKISSSLKGLCAGEKHPNYGKHLSEETRRKISNANKGKPSPNKGKPMSEEQKKKMSKIVLQFTLNGEFIREWDSFAECERNGYSHGNIINCCKGKRKSAYGFVWKYKD